MAISRDILFNINNAAEKAGTVSIPTSAVWNAGIVFNRTNAIPIDKFSVFDSYDEAVVYATTNPVAYPGQLIAVVPETGDATSYIILADGTLRGLAVDIDLTQLEENITADIAEKNKSIIDRIEATKVAYATRDQVLEVLANYGFVASDFNDVTLSENNALTFSILPMLKDDGNLLIYPLPVLENERLTF